jgi:hypothetical protein
MTGAIAGPSGLGGKNIDNLSRYVRKIHARGKRASGAEKRCGKKKDLLKKGR